MNSFINFKIIYTQESAPNSTKKDTGALKMLEEARWAESAKIIGGRLLCQMEVGRAKIEVV